MFIVMSSVLYASLSIGMGTPTRGRHYVLYPTESIVFFPKQLLLKAGIVTSTEMLLV